MKKLTLMLTILVGIFLGFVQELVKININYTLEAGEKIPNFYNQSPEIKKQWIEQTAIDAPFDYYHNHRKIDALLSLNQRELTMLKWGVTLLFIVLFFLINLTILHNTIGDKSVIRWFALLYAAFMMLAAGLYVFGKMTGTLNQSYAVSREIVGGLQSMIPSIFAFAAWWLWKKTQTVQINE